MLLVKKHFACKKAKTNSLDPDLTYEDAVGKIFPVCFSDTYFMTYGHDSHVFEIS